MKSTSKRGFTLIELMASVGIITAITAVVLFSYRTFNDSLGLSVAGQEVSIAVREAQVYGLSVKERSIGGGQFSAGYGINFNVNDPSNYYLFVDQNGDRVYGGNSSCDPSSECIGKGSLTNGVEISAICDETGNCQPGGSGLWNSIKSLNITFLRPDPDAKINFANGGGTIMVGNAQTGRVVLISPKGNTLNISIENTGQISIQ